MNVAATTQLMEAMFMKNKKISGEKARIKFLTNKGKSKKYLGLVIK